MASPKKEKATTKAAGVEKDALYALMRGAEAYEKSKDPKKGLIVSTVNVKTGRGNKRRGLWELTSK